MNIFATHPCPVKSAMFLDNKRVNKMITESLQMLAWAMHLNGASSTELPISKSTGKPYAINKRHLGHPCTLWASRSRGNYEWLLQHAEALQKEWKRRGGNGQDIKHNLLRAKKGASYIPEGEREPFVNTAANSSLGVSFKHEKDTCKAFRLYLQKRWKLDKIPPKWRFSPNLES